MKVWKGQNFFQMDEVKYLKEHVRYIVKGDVL